MTEVERVVDQLIRVGYLKYTSSTEFQVARKELIDSLSRGYLDTEWNRECVSRDRRTYPADSEGLAEGRTGEFILLMKEVLQVEGVGLDSVEDDFGEEQYDVVINGRRFKVYDSQSMATGNSWGIATKRFLDVVNELLQATGSEERLYGIYGGNDGRCILLTDEMYNFLKSPALKIDPRWMPYASTAISKDGRLET
jgi:hypothetical protein